MRMHPDFACPNCWGAGETECSCCNNFGECADCQGTGLDPDKVDIAKVKAWETEQFKAGHGTRSLLDEKHNWIGRQSYGGTGELRYADCLLESPR